MTQSKLWLYSDKNSVHFQLFQSMFCKVFTLIVFIHHVSTTFELITPLNVFLYHIVHSILEYGSILWNPFSDTAHIVHKKEWYCGGNSFVIVCINYIIYFSPLSLSSEQRICSMKSLAGHRHSLGKYFISNQPSFF